MDDFREPGKLSPRPPRCTLLKFFLFVACVYLQGHDDDRRISIRLIATLENKDHLAVYLLPLPTTTNYL